jgi:hypothetical protein
VIRKGNFFTNVPKQTKLNAEQHCDYRKRKSQENKTQASMSTEPTPIPIIHNYNQ